MDLEKIRKKYLRSWFCVDLVSAVPVECINLLWELVAYLGGVDGQSGHADGLRLLRILKLMRLAKLLRMLWRICIPCLQIMHLKHPMVE